MALRLSAVSRAAAAYLAVAAVAGLVAYDYVDALPTAIERDRDGPCMALRPQEVGPLDASFELPDRSGRKRRLEDFRGHVVLLNFWATWCPPCVEEMPSMEKLARRMKGRPFDFVAVTVDDSWDEVDDFFRRLGGDTALTVLRDPSRAVPHRFGTEKFPETYLVDRSGKVAYRFVNQRDWASEAAMQCVASFL